MAGVIPEFSWSPRRRRLWKNCKRRYAFTYLGAAGGFDLGAPPQVQKLHRLRNFLEKSTYIKRVISQLLHEEFYSGEEKKTLIPLTDRAMAKFAIEFNQMLRGTAFHDHSRPMLRELAENFRQAGSLQSEISSQLWQIADKIEHADWVQWRQIPTIRRRAISTPLAVQINELKCYCTPVAAAVSAGEYWIFEGFADFSCSAEIALIHKYYALIRLSRNPERVHSFRLSEETGEISEFGYDLDFSQTMNNISHDVEEILAANFPTDLISIPAKTESCHNCPFKIICQNN